MKKIRIAAFITAAFVLAVSVLSACQPTPDKPVIVNKANGKFEEKLQQTQMPVVQLYKAPEKLSMEIQGMKEGYRIVFEADVEVPDQTEWPVYIVEPADITQEEADAIRTALIGDTVLYKPGKYRSREEIQRSIDSYENELQISADEGYEELVEAYKKILKDLYIEYEQTPEEVVLEKADTEFKFMEDRLMPELYGGKEIILDDGGMRYEWTPEARNKAIAAGCENIYGVCWLGNGRKMEFSAGNGDFSRGLHYSTTDGNLVKDPGVTYSLEEAKAKGEALLYAMGLDYTLTDAITLPEMEEDEQGNFYEAGMKYHTLTYKRSIDGAPQDNIISCITQNIDMKKVEEYRPPVRSETITIVFDDYGVNSFSWSAPMRVVSKETNSVELLPFSEVQNRIEQQLKAQTIWENIDDSEAEWIDERRIEIDRIKLSYMQVAMKDDLDSCYLIPVWNVCGDLIYHYRDDYPTGKSNTYILNDKFERSVWQTSRYDEMHCSIVTINAVDGSAIERYRGY